MSAAERPPFTLRKLLEKFNPEELEKFMDVPLFVDVRDPAQNWQRLEIRDEWPNHAEPQPQWSVKGHFALQAYSKDFFRKAKAA